MTANPFDENDERMMRRALSLAERGRGRVEPNPMVGCVLAHGEQIVGEGFHQQFGGPHAEVEALQAAGEDAKGATLYVTLEPCCHRGKTPPCAEAVIAAGVSRAVAAMKDPFPKVDGGGFARLRQGGVAVEHGLLEEEARALNAPYEKLLAKGRPWIIAKWAMTLDGKIATASGDSQWISGEASRRIVHQLRGRVDAVMVGSRTARVDDPLLTARPQAWRTPTRIVVDSSASLAVTSRLAATADDAPVLIAAGPSAPETRRRRLQDAGCEVMTLEDESPQRRLELLLDELGRRKMTNILVEGGGRLLGSLFDLGAIDEAHVFIAPKLIGEQHAATPVAGLGVEKMAQAWRLKSPTIEMVERDCYMHGRIDQSEA